MYFSSFRLPVASALLAFGALSGCSSSLGPSPDLRLRRIVLYQNGIGYFERTGVLDTERLRLTFREHEVDDVLKSLVVVEEGAANARRRPSTVNVLLPEAKAKSAEDATTWLDVELLPRAAKTISVAYAVPTAAWKATYRVILPDASRSKGAEKRALLQAWALVDNVTDENWSDVHLTLATGAPLSFASDIRSPRYVPRPDAAGNMVTPVATGPVLAERTRPDSDGDGILDTVDKCPDTPESSSGLDDDGCPEVGSHRQIVTAANNVQVLSKVTFDSGSDALRKEMQAILDGIATTFRANSDIQRVVVEGHASADEKDGWELSARRAAAVGRALEQRGVTTELVPRAFGSSRPLVDDATAAGRAANRRVAFDIERREPGRDARSKARPGSSSDRIAAGPVAQTTRAAAAPRDVAGAVRYAIDDLISIPRRSSTLVTLINDYLPGADVYLFRPDPAAPSTSTHPLRAARLENRGAHGLEAGSVSIFADGSFVGEGLLQHLAPGETAMIPYAVDSSSSVRVVTNEADEPVRLVALARGVMTVENVSILRTRYEISAGAQAPATMYVRHARHEGFEARGLPAATESTVEAHVVPVPLTARKSSVLVVEERRPRRTEITVLDAEGPRLGLYLAGGLPPEADASVREVVGMRVALGKLEEEVASLRRRLGDTAQWATELRASLRAVEKTPRAGELQKKLVERLAQATARSDELSTELASRGAALSETRAQLTERLRDLTLEEKKPKAR